MIHDQTQIIFLCVPTSAACTDILLPVMFNDTFIIFICRVFSCTKCGCFCKVDFSDFILFETTLKVDEGREGETVSILHFFISFCSPNSCINDQNHMTLKPGVGWKVVKRQRLSEDKRK